ncbi:MAG TPA: response regulator transcription factor [Armatimonadota bacterium]|nr:response regulator transcription factor [Armatimonadota bacterium]
MANERILVVDDEEDILELMQYVLSKNGYAVTCVESGEDAIATARNLLPDMIFLDIMLPGVDGLDVCKILKKNSETAGVPIIMLTARGEEADIVTGLELGADDYITKPFSPRVLLARLRATLRRGLKDQTSNSSLLKIGQLTIDIDRHEVLLNDILVDLTYTEFQVLYLLAKRPGRVFTRYQIIDGVRGDDYAVTDRAVDVQIAGLRKKLGEYGSYVETVRGVGYRFKD